MGRADAEDNMDCIVRGFAVPVFFAGVVAALVTDPDADPDAKLGTELTFCGRAPAVRASACELSTSAGVDFAPVAAALFIRTSALACCAPLENWTC